MTTAEARERLTKHGLSDDQAAGVVDVLELWEKDRVITRDYFDKRLAELKDELKSWFFTVLITQTVVILGGVYFVLNYLPKHP